MKRLNFYLVILMVISSMTVFGQKHGKSSKGVKISKTNHASTRIRRNRKPLVPTGKYYWIQSVNDAGRSNGGCWDIPGRPQYLKKGMNIQTWAIDNGSDRLFKIEKVYGTGYYKIAVGRYSGKYVDLSGNNSKNGGNIQIWDGNNTSAQHFYFKYLGNGRYKIYHQSGRIVTLNNRSSGNGSNVHLWDDHNGTWCEWSFVDPHTHRVYKPY